MSQTIAEQKRARRNVYVLIAAQGLLGAQMPISFVLGGLSGQMLSTDKCFATLPISVIVLFSMLTAPFMSDIMQKQGRRTGFMIGITGGALGGLFSAAGLYWGSFELFLVGSACTGIYMSAHGFYRFAAIDTASEEFRPKAISWVMAGGLLAAVVGPQAVIYTRDALDPIPFAGSYIAVVVLNLLGVLIFAFLDIPKPEPVRAGEMGGRSRMELLKSPRIIVAMICAMVSYALMNLVMTSTPLAVVGCGFTPDTAASIVSAHVLAMYVPSFFTGNLIARFGAEKIVAIGLAILAGAGVAGLAGVEIENFYLALILLGVGWNFGFIGGTAMLASAHTKEEQGRVQGMNDFAVFGMVTLASFSSGILMNCSGGSAVEGWSAVNYAMLPLLTLAGGALIWITFAGRQKPA